jgi:hypothetical protein
MIYPENLLLIGFRLVFLFLVDFEHHIRIFYEDVVMSFVIALHRVHEYSCFDAVFAQDLNVRNKHTV